MFRTHRRRSPATVLGRQLRRHRRILEVEGLEGRVVLSPTIYTVDLATDSGPTSAGSGSGTTGDLRYVIGQANADPNPDGSIVQFDPTVFATPQMITLSRNLGTLDLTGTSGSEEIEGPTAGVTVSGGGAVGVFQVSSEVSASLSGMTISGGSATNGGGIDNDGALTLSGCTVSENTTSYGGGGIFNDRTLALADCTISGNSAMYGGGGINNQGTMSLTRCTVSSNSGGGGGGLSNEELAYSPTPYYGGTLTLTDCTVSGNSGFEGAGFEIIYGRLMLTDCTVSGNSAIEGGGGICTDLSRYVTLTGCTLSANSAQDGGGIDINDGELTLTDCTVSGNSAIEGGGLKTDQGATLTDCTVSGNTAGSGGGGGLYDSDGLVRLFDTIVAGNTDSDSASDIAPPADYQVIGSFNLIGTGGSGGITGGSDYNIVLTDLATLGLAPLGYYGGGIQTMALLPGSAAIGTGTAVSGITTDQRGVMLPATDPDIGAFQSQGFTLTTITDSTPQSAMVSAPFANALVVTVAANDPVEPVAGGVVTFAAPSGDASAGLSAATATIGSDGQASITATAGTTAGAYAVAASVGSGSSASFNLTNLAQPTFSVSNQETNYGTSSVILTGSLAAGSQYPIGQAISVTLDGVTRYPLIGPGGSFSTAFTTALLQASATAYTATYAFAAQDGFLAASGSSQLTVNPAALIITAVSDTKTYDGTSTDAAMPTFQVPGLPVNTLFNGDHFTALSQAFQSKDVLGTGGSTLLVTYALSDGAGSNDYTVTTQTASGTINPAFLSITADSLSIPFGGGVPPLTASYAGFVDGETPASLTTPVVLSTAATSDSPAGVYAITASGAGSANYNIRYIGGSLTIAAPIMPTTPQVRAANGFVATLYGEILGRGAEPSGLRYWTRKYLDRTPTRVIRSLFARSPERHDLKREGRTPAMPLTVAYADALRVARQAVRQPEVVPAGPRAFLKASHDRAKTDGVRTHGPARP